VKLTFVSLFIKKGFIMATEKNGFSDSDKVLLRRAINTQIASDKRLLNKYQSEVRTDLAASVQGDLAALNKLLLSI